MKRLPILLTTETRIDPITAAKNPSTSKPGTNEAASAKSVALITKINNPRVTIVIGIVRMTSKGRINALRAPNTMAAIIAALRLTIVIPL